MSEHYDPAQFTRGEWKSFYTDNAGGPHTSVHIGTHPTQGGKPMQLGGDYLEIAGVRNPYNGDTELISLAKEMAEVILLHERTSPTFKGVNKCGCGVCKMAIRLKTIGTK